jgi:hypothetical protein
LALDLTQAHLGRAQAESERRRDLLCQSGTVGREGLIGGCVDLASGRRTETALVRPAPFSEAQCKTLKQCPTFPDRFGSLEDARTFGQVFLPWYNDEHHHSSSGDPTGEGRRLG